MTEEEKLVLEKCRRRAKRFQRAYHEEELKALEAFNWNVESDLQLYILQTRIAELEAKLALSLGHSIYERLK